MILLVVDTQKAIMKETLYNFDNFVCNLKELIQSARSHHVEVIFIRHDDGIGTALTKGKVGYEIDEVCKPLPEEMVFDKSVNSAFKDSGLLPYLKERNEKEIMIVGLQSDYCIDANIKCGFEHGFTMLVPAYANTTEDNEFMTGEESYHYYNEFMWKARYATCLSMTDAIRKIRQVAKK